MEILLERDQAEVARSMVSAALETAIKIIDDEQLEVERAMRAEAERIRRERKKRDLLMATPTIPVTRPRHPLSCPTVGSLDSKASVRSDRLLVTEAMQSVLRRVYRVRCLKRADVVGGDKLARLEWKRVRTSACELKKMYALLFYVRDRETGTSSKVAYERAGKTVVRHDGTPTYWKTVRKWLRTFIINGGMVLLDDRGRHTKTHSYLSDPDIKARAIAWVREQLRNLRKKNNDDPPPSIDRFLQWVNTELLKEIIEQDPRRKPIGWTTAYNWLTYMGFEYNTHSKSIYYDGHERADVVIDRHEKLAMLKILEEVTVTFVGKDCEEVHACTLAMHVYATIDACC